MNANVHNLNTKKLTEFTTEDTIYIRNIKDDRGTLYLCKFLKFDKSKGRVCGEIIQEEDNGSIMTGNILEASYDKCALYGNATDEVGRAYYKWFDSSLYAMHPLEEHKAFENDIHVQKHPSYGMIGFKRCSYSGGKSLFGSSIQNKQIITLTIHRAEHNRNLNHDYFSANQELISVEMSQNQFAELITSFNIGDGVPCTINHINYEKYPEPPFQSKADIFQNEFKIKMQNFAIDMQKMVEKTTDILTNKPNIGKADRELIINEISSLFTEIRSNIPFVSQQFLQSMENTITEAKSSFDAFVENKIRSAGMEALGFSKENDMPLIEYNNKDYEVN